MRLIDADYALEQMDKDGNWAYDLTDLPAYLAGIPTVDAVPVDRSQFGDCRNVIAILQNEIQCVKDAEFCDRQCAKCKLVMEAEDIIAALECAIQAIKLCDASWTQRRNDHVKHTER